MCGKCLAENTGHKKLPFWHHRTALSGCVFAAEACIDNRGKNLLNTDTSPTCPHNMVNFSLLTAEICWRVLGTPANFNGFCVLAALLHGTLVVGVNQTLRHWTEGATYISLGGHHVGHRPTFVFLVFALQWHNMTLIRVTFGRVVWTIDLQNCALISPRMWVDGSQNYKKIRTF